MGWLKTLIGLGIAGGIAYVGYNVATGKIKLSNPICTWCEQNPNAPICFVCGKNDTTPPPSGGGGTEPPPSGGGGTQPPPTTRRIVKVTLNAINGTSYSITLLYNDLKTEDKLVTKAELDQMFLLHPEYIFDNPNNLNYTRPTSPNQPQPLTMQVKSYLDDPTRTTFTEPTFAVLSYSYRNLVPDIYPFTIWLVIDRYEGGGSINSPQGPLTSWFIQSHSFTSKPNDVFGWDWNVNFIQKGLYKVTTWCSRSKDNPIQISNIVRANLQI